MSSPQAIHCYEQANHIAEQQGEVRDTPHHRARARALLSRSPAFLDAWPRFLTTTLRVCLSRVR